MKSRQFGITVIPMMIITAILTTGSALYMNTAGAETSAMTTVADAVAASDIGGAVETAIEIGGLSGAELYIAIGTISAAVSPLIQHGLKQAIALTSFANSVLPLVIGIVNGVIAALLAGASPFAIPGLMIVLTGMVGGTAGQTGRDIKKRVQGD